MSTKSKKILVTGVAGFLGSHLSEELVNLGHKVVGIDNMLGGYEDNVPKNIEFHNADCCDFEKIKSIGEKTLKSLSENDQIFAEYSKNYLNRPLFEDFE